jgi:hypothetical protein
MKLTRGTEREKAAVAAWSFVHAALWQNEQFTEKEIAHNKLLIEEQFERGVSDEKNLMRFCIRVMMAKRYAEQTPNYVFPRPALWLNKNFEGGFVNTKSWYDHLLERRKNIAGYAQAMFTLGRGFARYAKSPGKEIFNHYRERLLHLKATKYAQTFYNGVVFFNYQN